MIIKTLDWEPCISKVHLKYIYTNIMWFIIFHDHMYQICIFYLFDFIYFKMLQKCHLMMQQSIILTSSIKATTWWTLQVVPCNIWQAELWPTLLCYTSDIMNRPLDVPLSLGYALKNPGVFEGWIKDKTVNNLALYVCITCGICCSVGFGYSTENIYMLKWARWQEGQESHEYSCIIYSADD